MQVLRERGLSPHRSLGQNFLIAGATAERMVEAAEIGPGDHVLEVGPGLGALTAPLAARAARVTAVEIDAGFARYLAESMRGFPNVDVVHADFLEYATPAEVGVVVSNMPYYCSTDILFKFAAEGRPRGFFMMQREFARRILARPASDNYGALSVTLNFYCRARELFGVPPSAFYPRPGVSSSFMCFDRRGDIPLSGRALALFHAAVKSAFWGRRKTLRAALSGSPHLSFAAGANASDALARSGLDPAARGETLSTDEFVRLARVLDEEGCDAVD